MRYQPIIAWATHTGLLSTHNEDQYACEDGLGLWVIADGMGGHAAGEVASQLAINAVVSSFRSGSLLDEAVADAHPTVLEAISNDPVLSGMGTTVVAAHLQNTHYQIAWVGDSRCYHWSKLQFRQITRDHSLLESLLDSDEVDADTAYGHPERKSLIQAIGVSPDMCPTVGTSSGDLYHGEFLLLCSDGLTDEVDDSQIADILAATSKPQAICEQLISAALRNGGRDNITTIIIKASGRAPYRPGQDNSLANWLIGAGMLLTAALLWLVFG